MNPSDLKEYLSIIVDMESELFFQERLIEQLQKDKASLGLSHDIGQMPVEPLPPKEVVLHVSGDVFARDSYSLGIVTLVASIPIFLLCQYGLRKGLLASVCSFLGIITFIYGDYWSIKTLIRSLLVHRIEDQEMKKLTRVYDGERLQYQSELQQWQELKAADDERVSVELKAAEYIQKEIDTLQKRHQESKTALKSFYSGGVIFPKYRNYPMVASIYEYISSGRCNALEGSQGAYNILETEIRLDKLVSKMDQIISKLDTLIDNQYTLYKTVYAQLSEANQIYAEQRRQMKEICSEISSLKKYGAEASNRLNELLRYSAMTAHNVEQVKKEEHFFNRVRYFAGEYPNVYYWQLPKA